MGGGHGEPVMFIWQPQALTTVSFPLNWTPGSYGALGSWRLAVSEGVDDVVLHWYKYRITIFFKKRVVGLCGSQWNLSNQSLVEVYCPLESQSQWTQLAWNEDICISFDETIFWILIAILSRCALLSDVLLKDWLQIWQQYHSPAFLKLWLLKLGESQPDFRWVTESW